MIIRSATTIYFSPTGTTKKLEKSSIDQSLLYLKC
ncbi:hypothetical protein SAMN05421842_1173 [Clostridium uliginosum]|uniref:Uncharacterized protein n=1 Tax=Clostridium uliginosum TaxID=119641 RepID=A0A1I1NWA6_9CLOT|nr:hypothetical protein SAMN05421842_1173 [Clostridium uliginosum]